ncbi:hypothetical protein KKA50_03230 [Patescibacteria group bacterium]|nr:hypothetical protein [Patescibacteria group bacterium]
MDKLDNDLELLLEQAENTPVARERRAGKADLQAYLSALVLGQISPENKQIEFPVTHKLVALGMDDDIIWGILHTEAYSDRFPVMILERGKSEAAKEHLLVDWEVIAEEGDYDDVIPAMNPTDMTKPGILVPAFVYKENLNPELLGMIEEKLTKLGETNPDFVTVIFE